VSVGAISWAPNLARSRPIAASSRPARTSSCSSAWPAMPGGTARARSRRWPRWSATPACRSGRRARAWIGGRLGVIRPCDRDVVAARIKRADRRPKGWDLDPSLIRDELTEATSRHWCISSLACAPRSRACHSLPRCFSRPDGRRPVPRLAARVAHGFTAAVRCPMLRCRRDHGGDDWDPAETGSHSARSSLRAAAAKALRSGTASRSATTVMLSCPA